MKITVKEIIRVLEEIRPYLMEEATSDLVYRTPAQQLRHMADIIEKRDKVLQELDKLLSKLVKEKEE